MFPDGIYIPSLLYYNSNIWDTNMYLSYGIQTWHDGRLMRGIHAHAHFDDLDLNAKSKWFVRYNASALNYLDN